MMTSSQKPKFSVNFWDFYGIFQKFSPKFAKFSSKFKIEIIYLNDTLCLWLNFMVQSKSKTVKNSGFLSSSLDILSKI